MFKAFRRWRRLRAEQRYFRRTGEAGQSTRLPRPWKAMTPQERDDYRLWATIKADAFLPPMTCFEIRLSAVEDFGRRQSIAWYTNPTIQEGGGSSGDPATVIRRAITPPAPGGPQ